MKFQDLTGQKFGLLTAQKFVGRKDSQALWQCKCDCGVEKIIRAPYLKNGTTKSCGCFRSAYLKKAKIVHGNYYTPEYRIFHHAKGRCDNPSDRAYSNYGGRGIEFRFTSVADVLDEIGRRPSKLHTFDRKNNNGHYEKGNIRWATRKEQNSNKRNNNMITFQGETFHLADWARKTGIHCSTLRRRIKDGYCVRCAFTLPKREICSHQKAKLNLQ